MPKRAIDEEFRDHVREVFRSGTRRHADVWRDLQKWAYEAGHHVSALPTKVTVQRWVNHEIEIRGREPWVISEADSDAEQVLPALGALIAFTDGAVVSVTKNEARWIAQVNKVASDLHGLAIYQLASHYLEREKSDQTSTDLDAFLAVAPWRRDDRIRPDDDPFGPGDPLWRRRVFDRLLEREEFTTMQGRRDLRRLLGLIDASV